MIDDTFGAASYRFNHGGLRLIGLLLAMTRDGLTMRLRSIFNQERRSLNEALLCFRDMSGLATMSVVAARVPRTRRDLLALEG